MAANSRGYKEAYVLGALERNLYNPNFIPGLRKLHPELGDACDYALKVWDPLESTCRHASLSIL